MNVLRTAFPVKWAVVASLCCSAAAQVAEPPWNVSSISHLGGWCWGVDVKNEYVYMNEGGDLTILDVPVTSSPIPLGHLSFGDFRVGDIQIINGLAYMTAGTVAWEFGLLIVDITTPLLPRVLSFCPTRIAATDVYVTEGLAYVACGREIDWQGGF